MVLAFSIRLAGVIHAYLHVYGPTNVLIRYLRSAEGRKWALPLSLAFTIGYLAATVGLTAALNAGAPGWLNILGLVAAWNAVKFACLAALEVLLALRWATGPLLRRARREAGLGLRDLARRRWCDANTPAMEQSRQTRFSDAAMSALSSSSVRNR